MAATQSGMEIREKCLWPKDEQSNTPSPGSRADVVLTTYEMVNFDKSALGKIEWSAVVVDEAHKLKNCKSKLFNELSLFKKTKDFVVDRHAVTKQRRGIVEFIEICRSATIL